LVARYLIKTADERTWPKNQPVIFLGEWCRRYSRRSVWQNMDSIIAPYHWDDRKKLYKDYLYIQKVYEDQLKELSLKLNQIHGVDNSLRYWRILIGPWLGIFIQILFDRWAMLKQVIDQGEANACRIFEMDEISVIPNNTAHFFHLSYEDNWNEKIYGQLIQLCWSKNFHAEKIYIKKDSNRQVSLNSKSSKFLIKSLVKKFANYFYPLLVQDDEYFFISSYLPLKTNIHLQLRLWQFPKLWQFISPENIKPDLQKRLWGVTSSGGKDEFVEVLRKIIPLHIPTVYFEGYEALVRKIKDLPWPNRPKAIFSSNSYASDDVFKAWAAEKTEIGIPLIIGQHGGHYGMTPWSFYEEHQITISDMWLSWGWSDLKNPQVKPVGNLKLFGQKVNYDPNGDALIIEMSLPRYSYHMYAAPVASQWLSYFDDQCRFINALPNTLQKNILIRLQPHRNFGWEDKQRWGDKFPNIKTTSDRQSLYSIITRSRIGICTYNATTYLECLTWNIPTIIFWNPEYWELREEIKPYFEKLKSVGIFHETPESAASHMATIWDDIASWWESDEVQSARSDFCKQFSHIPEKPLDKLEAIFKDAVRPNL
jgi:putative transferase (TIGR04331 family)